jgi:hypothetical protein
MAYHVYQAIYKAPPIDHHAIFIETDTDGSGFRFQVDGSIYRGMDYNHESSQPMSESEDFSHCFYLGTIAEGNYELVQATVETIPPPHKQMSQGGLIDRSLPAVRSKEWTEAAIAALKEAGILKPANQE